MELGDRPPLKDPQYIVAFSVALISICALVVSIMQTRIMSEQRSLMHEQAKAAVWPRVELGVSKSHSLEDKSVTDYTLNVSNSGVGPAIIHYVKVSFDDQPVQTWWDLFDYFTYTDSVPRYITNSNLSRNIMRAGEDLTILDLSNNLPLAQVFYAHSQHISIEVYYKSIYGDMWKYSMSIAGEETELLEREPVFNEEEKFLN